MVNKIKKIILIVFILINMMSISVLAKTEKYSFQIIDNLSENDLSNEDKISVVIELDYNELDNKEILKDDRIKGCL